MIFYTYFLEILYESLSLKEVEDEELENLNQYQLEQINIVKYQNKLELYTTPGINSNDQIDDDMKQ